MPKKAKASLNIANLDFLSAFAPSPELKDRMKKAEAMLRQKVKESLGVEVGGEEWREIVKMRHWVSRDPEMAKRIRQAHEIFRLVNGTVVEMELTKDELEGMIEHVERVVPFADDHLRKLQDALGQL